MIRKKILIVSASFFPVNAPRSFRTTELSKEFARQGHAVTVITPKNPEIHTEFERKYNLVIKDLGKRKLKVVAIKGNSLNQLFRRFAARILKLFFEYPNIELYWMVKKALKNESGYDLLTSIAVPYPVHWGVAASRSKSHPIAKKWIADCGDPYVGQENNTFKIPFYFNFVEKWFMRRADFITVPTKGAIHAYFPEFHAKIRVIPQGFRFEEYTLTNKKVSNTKPTFAYAGMFIPERRDPSEFIKFLLEQGIDYEFHLYTTTPHLLPVIPDGFKSKIIVHKPVPREELLKSLSRMDFLVNFENIGSRQTPSKLIDYLILDKPVLSVKTGNLDVITAKEFLTGNYRGKLVFEEPEQFRIENVVKKFLALDHADTKD